MAVPMRPAILILPLLLSFFLPSSAQNCTSETFSNNRRYSLCNSLGHLNATLHWTYHPSNGTADIAYRAPETTSNFVAWAINPSSSGMIGANALLAYHSGGVVTVISYVFKSFQPTVGNENLTFDVYGKEAEYSNGVYTIYATVALPNNKTTFNTVWQAGVVSSGLPAGHVTSGDNVKSLASTNFLGGVSSESGGGNSSLQRNNDCTSETFSNNRRYSLCNSLGRLSATLHWTYHPSNGTADIAYRAPETTSNFVAWAINPSGSGMIGANALLAYHSGGVVTVISYVFDSFQPTVRDENLTFDVYSKEADYSNGVYTIYATVALPNNKTTFNTAWQAGAVNSGLPAGHATSGDNVNSLGSTNFLLGVSSESGGGNSRLHRKNIHGVLNAVSWGVLMPLGAIIARYLRVFKSADPAWFYLHVTCQCSAYIIGVSGWGLGLKLGSESKGITYHSHRDIGIALFSIATLQMFALLLRPNKDHKYRIYWNVYHHLVGYSLIILSVVNIFKGFDILDPAKKWKHAYIAVIATLGGIALVLEAVTWAIVLKRRSGSSDKFNHSEYGTNGYGGRQQQGA